MGDIKMYNLEQTCEKIGVTRYTLINWYAWEKKLLESGEVGENYLPIPYRMNTQRGKPRMWDDSMIKELKRFKKHIIIGRNGKYGKFSNPFHKNTKKYKKQMEEQNERPTES